MAGPVVLRAQWATHLPDFTRLDGAQPLAVEHHTAGDSPGNDLIGWLRSWEAGQMARGDGLVAAAYNWLTVSGGPHDGTKVELRPWWAKSGATMGHNHESRAVCMSGNFETGFPTEAAMDSNAELWAEAMRDGFVSRAAVIEPHELYYPTACAGMHLNERLPDLRARVARKLGGAAPSPPKPTPRKDENVQTYKWLDHNANADQTRAVRVDDKGRIALFGGASLYCEEVNKRKPVKVETTPFGKFVPNLFAEGVSYLGSTEWEANPDGFVLLGIRPNGEVAMRHFAFRPID